MFCTNCGAENGATDKFCKNCGQPLETVNEQQENMAGSAQTTPDPAPVPVQYNTYQQEPIIDENKPTGAAIASMVLGIVSIVCCCTNVIAIICGIVAIVLAKREEKNGNHNGIEKAGFICGLIGAILGFLYLIYLIVIVVLGVTAATSTIPFSNYSSHY